MSNEKKLVGWVIKKGDEQKLPSYIPGLFHKRPLIFLGGKRGHWGRGPLSLPSKDSSQEHPWLLPNVRNVRIGGVV